MDFAGGIRISVVVGGFEWVGSMGWSLAGVVRKAARRSGDWVGGFTRWSWNECGVEHGGQ